MLHDFSPWQEQVREEMQKTQERLGTSKSSKWNYVIENGHAEIYVTKI